MFKDIHEILPKTIKKVGIHQEVKAKQVEKLFQEELERLLTANLLGRIKILYFKDGIITIACLDEAIVEKLRSCEEQIIYRINGILCNNSLQKVQYLS